MNALDGARWWLVVLELVVDLEPIALGVSHNQPTIVRIEYHSRGESEPPFLLEVAHFSAPLHRAGVGLQRHLGPFGEFLGIAHKTGDNFAIGVEDLDAVVGPVAHIHIAIGVYGHVGGTVQLALACPVAAELTYDLAIRGEFLDAVVLMIGDVHMALLVYGNAPGGTELTRSAAEAAPLHQERAVLGKLLHPMIAAVDDIQHILWVNGDPRRCIELTITAAGLFILAKRAFLKKSELKITRRVRRMSHCDARKAVAMVSMALRSRGGVVIQAGTCGSSATKKLYKWRAINR